MRIAVIGGGITGLVCAFELASKGHTVSIYEKSPQLGGLASGFNNGKWKWQLEHAYHHIFENDHDIINFARKVDYKDLYFTTPLTASLTDDSNIYPFDTPKDLLLFPHLSLIGKMRAGFTILFLKISPFLRYFQNNTSKHFLVTFMGKKNWNVLWEELFRKKFGKYAEKILSSFIWARIKKRTKRLGYARGGFQTFIQHLENILAKHNVVICKDASVKSLSRKKERFEVNDSIFDAVVCTLVSPYTGKIAENILPQAYAKKLQTIRHLNAVVLIIESKQKILEKVYWLNILKKDIPMMCVIQHTNFVDKKYYGGNNIAYIANYVDDDSSLLTMTKDEMVNYFLPHLKTIKGDGQLSIVDSYLFKAPLTQPVIDRDFILSKPDYITPVKNFYIANLEMTYPYDRGINFAVKMGIEVAKKVLAG